MTWGFQGVLGVGPGLPPGLHIIGSGDQYCWSSFRFDVGILGTVIVRILVLACSIGVLVEILVVVAAVVATFVGAILSVLGRASASIQSVRVPGTRREQT